MNEDYLYIIFDGNEPLWVYKNREEAYEDLKGTLGNRFYVQRYQPAIVNELIDEV